MDEDENTRLLVELASRVQAQDLLLRVMLRRVALESVDPGLELDRLAERALAFEDVRESFVRIGPAWDAELVTDEVMAITAAVKRRLAP